MKKLYFILLVYLLPLFLLSAEIDSIEKLKSFMDEGQRKGYFPKTLLLPTFTGPKKLREVDLAFRTVIQWNNSSKCPSHEDEIILALGSESHSIVCNAGNTAGILGPGDDWVDDATGNDIYYPGRGNDIVDVGSGNDILIFDLHWGQDKVKIRSEEVDTRSILGYDGSYPWKYSDFIIFGKEVKREDIVWDGNSLYHLKTGDSIVLNTKKINILFASDPRSESVPVPIRKRMALEDIKSESLFRKGKILYLAKGNEGLHIIDVQDPENAVVLSKLVLPGRAMDVVVEGNIAYVAQGDFYLSGKRGWVSIIDVKDKKVPKLLKTLKFGNSIRSIAVGNNRLYISDTHFSSTKRRTLHIYDTSNPSMPTLLSSTKLYYFMRQMVYFDHTLYFISNHQRLKVMDVSDPLHIRLVKESPLFGQAVFSVAIKGDLFVYTQKEHIIKMFRLQKNHHPKAICVLETMQIEKQRYPYGQRNTLVIEDGLVYSSENTYGISVSSIKSCKVLNILPVWNIQRVNALVKLDHTLVSFKTNEKGRIYPLQKDMIHEKMPVYSARRTSAAPKASSTLSQDQLQTLLYKASTRENVTEIKRLCALGANPNENGHERYTPVEIASRLGRTKALKVLLECGGKATQKCMFLAALTEKEEAMKILEKHGVPVTVRDKRKNTTLHYIAQDGRLTMVQYLVKQGVSYDVVNKKGESPLTWANYGANCAVIDYLESLYPSGYKKVGNKKCKKKRLKEKLQKINDEIRRLERKNKPAYWEAKSMGIRLKSKQKGDSLNVKFQFSHPMVSPFEAEKKGINVDYVDHITLKVGERVVFDMSNHPYLNKNPVIKLKVKNCETDKKLSLILRTNWGITKSKSINIRTGNQPVPDDCHVENGEIHDFQKSHPEFWKAQTVNQASIKLYGNVTYQEGSFEMKMPKLAVGAWSIPIQISSDLNLESMAVLTNGNDYPAIAVFSVPKGTKVNYYLKIKIKTYGEYFVKVIAKGRDGKFYKSMKVYEVAGPSTCDGS